MLHIIKNRSGTDFITYDGKSIVCSATSKIEGPVWSYLWNSEDQFIKNLLLARKCKSVLMGKRSTDGAKVDT